VIDTSYCRKVKKIQFNFKQMAILERMKRIYDDINLLIRKLIIFDEGGITVNNDYFNNFNEKSLHFFYKSIHHNISSQVNYIKSIK
jgi:hypothetical protein